MKNVIKGLSVLALVGFSAVPVLAQDSTSMDVSTMTCGDLMKMDHDGMMKAADNAEMAMKSEGMSDADKATMQQQMDNMTETEKTDHMKVSEENVTKLQTACAGNDSMTVMDAMKAQ